MRELTDKLDKPTALGEARIVRNLSLETGDIVGWCRRQIERAGEITRKGKNWYVYTDNAVITVNAHSYTIITAHKRKLSL